MLGDMIAVDLAGLGGHSRQREGRRRVETEGLFDDGLEEGEAGEVGLADEAVWADNRVELHLGLLENFWVADQL